MIKYLYKFSEKEFGSGSGFNYPKPKKGFLWIHLTKPDQKEITKIRNDFKLADLIFEKFSKEVRSTRYFFKPLTFVMVNYYLKNKSIEVENVLFIVGENYIITITKTPLPHYDEIYKGVFERIKFFKLNVGYLLHEILDNDAEQNFEVLHEVEIKISQMEKGILVYKKMTEKIKEIIEYKRYLLRMWRRFWGSSKILFSIKKGLTPIKMDENLVRLFDDIHDTFIYQMEIISVQREVLTDALTIYEAVIANTINSGIKRLTVIMFIWTAIATVLSIPNTVATIFGIPEWPLTVDVWEFIAFVLVISALVPILWFYLYWKKLKMETM